MTNKRQIKKYVDRVGTDIAEILLPGAVYTKTITDSQAIEMLNEISLLRTRTLARLNIAYDKAPDTFETPQAYKAAKRRYYKEAYGKALKEFEEGVEKTLAPLNAARKK